MLSKEKPEGSHVENSKTKVSKHYVIVNSRIYCNFNTVAWSLNLNFKVNSDDIVNLQVAFPWQWKAKRW